MSTLQTVAIKHASSTANNITLATDGSLTFAVNTATVGTAAYFVANGNLGIANSAPVSKLHVQGAINGSFPRYKVTYDTTGTRTTPNTFVATIVSSIPSFGQINYWNNASAAPSLLFEMTLYCTSAVTATQYVSYVDDNVYFWLNGASVANVTGAGAKTTTVTYNLVTGNNTIQIVYNNSGGTTGGLDVWGDFLYRYSNVTFLSA